MWRKAAAALMMMFCLVLFSIPAWGLAFEPGLYEVTSRVEMPGMPAGMVPSHTIDQCLTKENPVPNNDAGGQACEIIDMNQDGKTLTWKMECAQQGEKITSVGQMTYNGDSFSGTSTTSMGPQAGNMTITTRISGTRIGDCP